MFAITQTIGAVRLDEALLELHGVELAAQDLPRELDVALAIVGVRDLVVALADELVAATSEHRAERVVDAHVAPVRAEDGHADRRVVKGRVEVGGEVLDELVALDDAQQAQRRAVDLARAQRLQANRRAVGLIAHDDVGDRPAEHVGGGPAQQLQCEVVRVDDEPVVVEHDCRRSQ